MPSRASSRPAPVIASPWTKGSVAGTAAGLRPKPRSSWPSPISAGSSDAPTAPLAPVSRIRMRGPSSPIGGRINIAVVQSELVGAVGDERCERERRRGGRGGGVADVDGAGRGGEQEVVDEAAVAGDGLGADAGEGGGQVVGRDARVRSGWPRRRRRGGWRRGAARWRRCASGGCSMRHVPGQLSACGVGHEQGGGAEQDVAVDGGREVDAEEREGGIGDGVDEAADEVAALGREAQVGAAEGDDAGVGVGAGEDGEAVGPQAGAEDGAPGFDIVAAVGAQADRACGGGDARHREGAAQLAAGRAHVGRPARGRPRRSRRRRCRARAARRCRPRAARPRAARRRRGAARRARRWRGRGARARRARAARRGAARR